MPKGYSIWDPEGGKTQNKNWGLGGSAKKRYKKIWEAAGQQNFPFSTAQLE